MRKQRCEIILPVRASGFSLIASSLPPLCLLDSSSDFEENRGAIEENPRTQRGGNEENPRRKSGSSHVSEESVTRFPELHNISSHSGMLCEAVRSSQLPESLLRMTDTPRRKCVTTRIVKTMANDEKVKLSQTLSCNIGAYNFIWCWVEIVNRNTMNMTVRQKVLKAIYPIFSMYNRVLGNKSRIISNKENFTPPVSIYDLSFKLNDGNPFSMKNAKGKKLLIVNTASDCGYTGQYVELQKLYQEYKDKLLVIGFPANDFKDQEMRSDEEIEQFCTYNYGVTFPLAAKSTVVKSPGQNEIYKWLTHKSHNGWNENQPSWNFAKFLINETGVLTNYFDPSISPVSDQVLEKLKN